MTPAQRLSQLTGLALIDPERAVRLARTVSADWTLALLARAAAWDTAFVQDYVKNKHVVLITDSLFGSFWLASSRRDIRTYFPGRSDPPLLPRVDPRGLVKLGLLLSKGQ